MWALVWIALISGVPHNTPDAPPEVSIYRTEADCLRVFEILNALPAKKSLDHSRLVVQYLGCVPVNNNAIYPGLILTVPSE